MITQAIKASKPQNKNKSRLHDLRSKKKDFFEIDIKQDTQLTYNISKITTKGTNVPRSIVLTQDSVTLVSDSETRWTKKPGQIIGLSSDDPEGKTFTLTTVHQLQFQSDDPSVQQKLRMALGKINAGVPSM
ncbi:MAG: hypothetical protein EZS28_031280 [Streblomastix strix]|uniref:Uncharacterized protein n=1 Tax=Streblomastix strix TaxID=222440 RepID=A0A5J4USJ6_9EUKA|nr:MAG: hypothetical protein EZS28_031280 [Streblomastix strix]